MTTQTSRPRFLFWRLYWEELRDDQIRLRASALAFQTLASWLPLMAIVLAVMSSPAFEAQRARMIERLALSLVPESNLSAALPDFGPSLLPDLCLPGDELTPRQEMQSKLEEKHLD